MHEEKRNRKAFSEDEVFREFGELILLLDRGEGGAEVAARLQGIIRTLSGMRKGYFYPWYCLLAALSVDRLRYINRGEWFVRWDRDPELLTEAFVQAHRTWDEFWKENPLSVMGDEVRAFLDEALRVFVADCWHVIDFNLHERLGTRKMQSILMVIPVDDVHARTCNFIYDELHALLAAGRDNLVIPLRTIVGLELECEWPVAEWTVHRRRKGDTPSEFSTSN